MAQQRLETVIAINATTGNGFSEVGSTLTQMGALVDGLSQQLIDFGRESINVYRDYEKSMADAEVALSTTYGKNSKELKTVMADLDLSATEWAANTKFHTNDIANAVSEAAHAGWDYEQIMSGIPAAINLASAGSLDLSEAVNYVVKATNAAGIEFQNTGDFIDLWTYAANSSATTVQEFGEAMLRMGSTMRFAANPEELMTLIAVTANAGSVGSEAGTLIRNSILRLIAPTQKASDMMAELGASSEETAELMNNEALQAAYARLEMEGFSAYDSNGQMKSVLDDYRDLYVALVDIAGGVENIEQNEDAMQILSAIFPTRTITEALALLRGAANDYDGLFEKMQSGAAEGYAEYAAERMLDTLDGRIEIFKSKFERLQQVTGEALSDDLSNFMSGAGDFIDSIAEMDSGKFDALVSGLEVIAVSGPALLTAGGALRFIGNVLSPTGMIAMGTIGVAALTRAINELSDAAYESQFGTAELDNDAIMSYINSLTVGYEQAYTEVDAFRTAVDESIESYKEASSTFTSDLLTNMLTGATLTDSDIAELENLGSTMHTAVIDGITNSADASISYWEVLFGGQEQAENSDAYNDIFGATQYAFDESIAKAEEIGQGLRDAMNSAFADGHISEEEYQNILSYVQSYNEAMAQAAQEATDRENDIFYEKMLHKAQTASEEEMKELTKEIRDKTEALLAEEDERYEAERAALIVDYNKAIEDGVEFRGGEATPERLEELLAEADSLHQSRRMEISETGDKTVHDLYDSQAKQSDFADQYLQLESLAREVLDGTVSAGDASALFKQQYGNNAFAGEMDLFNDNIRTMIGETLARELDGLGGFDEVRAKIADYTAKGDSTSADMLMLAYTMQQINDNFAETGVQDFSGWLALLAGDDVITSTADAGHGGEKEAGRENFEATLGNREQTDFSLDKMRTTIDAFGTGEDTITAFFNTVSDGINGQADELRIQQQYNQMSEESRKKFESIMDQLYTEYDFEKIRQDTGGNIPIAQEDSGANDFFSMYQLLYGDINPEQYRIQIVPEIDESAMQELGPYPVTIQPHTEGEDSVSALQDQGVNVQVDGDTQQLEAKIEASEGQELLEYINGDATNLSMSIYDQDGKTLVETVTGNTSALANAINAYNGQTITVNIQGRKLFAAGGRATEASVFGEAGPEWAIPEEHTTRTADLLDAARQASGFTWPELLSRYGGLNANANNTPSTLIYSPTINATNADGVEKALLDDKERLDKWYREKQMRDEVEEFR